MSIMKLVTKPGDEATCPRPPSMSKTVMTPLMSITPNLVESQLMASICGQHLWARTGGSARSLFLTNATFRAHWQPPQKQRTRAVGLGAGEENVKSLPRRRQAIARALEEFDRRLPGFVTPEVSVSTSNETMSPPR